MIKITGLKALLPIMFITAITLIVAGFIAANAAEQNKAAPDDDARPYIVTTTAHIADLVQNIAGDKVRVEPLIGTGIDPHLYRPVRSDIVKLTNADIIFYNGRHLEGQMVELLETLGKSKPSIGIGDQMDDLIRAKDGAFDPHLWMDVRNWIKATDIVTNTLHRELPAHQTDFAKAANRYKAQLQALDDEIRQSIASIPDHKRVLITAHDAFAYYGAAYGIEVIGIQGISTASEAGLHQIESMVDLVSKRNVPALFAETSVSNQNVKAIIEGAQRKGHNVKLGGTLYSDSLAAPGSKAGTYIGMMRANTGTIVEALSASTQTAKSDLKATTSN